MKLIPQINYDDEDYKLIRDLKDNLKINWHDFILTLVKFYDENQSEDDE